MYIGYQLEQKYPYRYTSVKIFYSNTYLNGVPMDLGHCYVQIANIAKDHNNYMNLEHCNCGNL